MVLGILNFNPDIIEFNLDFVWKLWGKYLSINWLLIIGPT